jgi:hypothetical protein
MPFPRHTDLIGLFWESAAEVDTPIANSRAGEQFAF